MTKELVRVEKGNQIQGYRSPQRNMITTPLRMLGYAGCSVGIFGCYCIGEPVKLRKEMLNASISTYFNQLYKYEGLLEDNENKLNRLERSFDNQTIEVYEFEKQRTELQSNINQLNSIIKYCKGKIAQKTRKVEKLTETYEKADSVYYKLLAKKGELRY